MNIIERGTGYLPDGTKIYIEDWTADYKSIDRHFTVAAFPVSLRTLPGTWSPDAGRKFRYGMTFGSFQEAAACADALIHGEKKLADFADHLERPEYLACVQEANT